MTIEPALQLPLGDELATLALAERCARLFLGGGVIFLGGDLGAGKTTFSRGVLRALGYQGAVKSPTYTLMEPYQVSGIDVYHCDFYRLSAPDELEYLGLRDFAGGGSLWLIEWPERGAGCLPPADLSVLLRVDGQGRQALLSAGSEHGRRWLDDLRA